MPKMNHTLDTFLFSGPNRIKRILRRLNVIHYWCLDVSLPHFPLIFPKSFGAEATFSIRQVFAPKAGCAFLFGLGGLYFPIQTYNQAWTPTALTLEDGNSRLRTGGPGHGMTRWWCGTWVDVQQCLCHRTSPVQTWMFMTNRQSKCLCKTCGCNIKKGEIRPLLHYHPGEYLTSYTDDEVLQVSLSSS